MKSHNLMILFFLWFAATGFLVDFAWKRGYEAGRTEAIAEIRETIPATTKGKVK